MGFYPSWRYHPDGRRTVVQDPTADEALGPGWCHSPADFAKPDGPPAPPPVLPVIPQTAEDAEEAAKAAELHATGAKDVIAALASADADALARVKAREERNPKGARKGVLTAIEARAKALAPAAE